MMFAPLCLLVCWMLPANSVMIRLNFTLRDAIQDIPLNMAEESVDDMYLGCNDAMAKKVKDIYLNNELKDKPFKAVWTAAETCAAKKEKDNEDEALTKDHMQAICAYTSHNGYQEFNEAVRNGRKSYSSSFKFHSLHFLLTSAVQILNSNKVCHTTYRRTSVKFTGVVNKLIRFGSFASSSKKTDLITFGKETCFKIETCSGAFLKGYSTLEKNEQEVLIPPYEQFKITEKIEDQTVQGLNDCKVVYILKNDNNHSNLNCKAVNL